MILNKNSSTKAESDGQKIRVDNQTGRRVFYSN